MIKRDLLSKMFLDAGEAIVVASFWEDLIQQIIIACAVVLINVILYPLLKAVLLKLNKKFNLNLKIEEVEKIEEEVKDKVEEILKESIDKKE